MKYKRKLIAQKTIKTDDVIPETVPDGYNYYLFMMSQTLEKDFHSFLRNIQQGGFIAKRPEGITDIPTYSSFTPGTDVIIAEVDLDQFSRFVNYLKSKDPDQIDDITQFDWIRKNRSIYIHKVPTY